jgi:hypothetical protein
MEGVALVPGIYASMELKHRYSSVIVKATTLDGIMTILVSVIGFVAYGAMTQEIVLMNLSYGLFSSFVQLLYSLSVLCSFAL